ncbi:MAG: hypothetical protein MI784_04950 [Cytophagales bacterium]|nr:hypothetical protein [Cytophagales bacterium]
MNRKNFHTLEKVFEKPMQGELSWYALEAMLHSVGAHLDYRDAKVDMQERQQLKVKYDVHELLMDIPENQKLGEGEMLQDLRGFLLQHDIHPDHESFEKYFKSRAEKIDVKLIAAISSHETRIYEVGYEGTHFSVKQPDRDGFRHHMHHKKSGGDFQPQHFKGQRTPEYPTYMRDIAKSLAYADEILLIGHGDGHSNEAKQFWKYLKEHDKEMAAKVVACIRMGDYSEKTMLVKAKEVFGFEAPRQFPPGRF